MCPTGGSKQLTCFRGWTWLSDARASYILNPAGGVHDGRERRTHRRSSQTVKSTEFETDPFLPKRSSLLWSFPHDTATKATTSTPANQSRHLDRLI